MSEHTIRNMKYDTIIGGLKDAIAKLENDSTQMASNSNEMSIYMISAMKYQNE